MVTHLLFVLLFLSKEAIVETFADGAFSFVAALISYSNHTHGDGTHTVRNNFRNEEDWRDADDGGRNDYPHISTCGADKDMANHIATIDKCATNWISEQ